MHTSFYTFMKIHGHHLQICKYNPDLPIHIEAYIPYVPANLTTVTTVPLLGRHFRGPMPQWLHNGGQAPALLGRIGKPWARHSTFS